MASGEFEFATGGGKLQGKISWSSTSNGSSANSSNVTAILYARKTVGTEPTKGQSWSGWVHVNGAGVDISFSTIVPVARNWVEMARTTQVVPHNANGTRVVGIDGSVTAPTGTSLAGTTSNGSQNVTLDTIPRYTSITSFTSTGKTTTSISFSWQAADTVDKLWYSTNNGNSWNEKTITEGTSGSFTVNNLSQNTTYNCKIRVRRKDSQLLTDSSALSVKTYAKAYPTIQVASKTSTSITVSSTCSVDASIQYRKRPVGGSWGSYQDGATFTGLAANTNYEIEVKCVGTASGETESASCTGATYQTTIPTISLRRKTINRIDVVASANVPLQDLQPNKCISFKYRIKKSGESYGDYTYNNYFTRLAPNTTYIIEVWCIAMESGESGTATLQVTTYDMARITNASNINFGDTIEFSMTNPGGERTELTIYFKSSQGQLIPIVRRNYIPNQYNFELSDYEWDSFYRRMNTVLGNTVAIRYELITISDGIHYPVYTDKTLTMTGNQKTAHVGVNGIQKRAKVYVGIGGNVKRAIVWVGIGGKKRCI